MGCLSKLCCFNTAKRPLFQYDNCSSSATSSSTLVPKHRFYDDVDQTRQIITPRQQPPPPPPAPSPFDGTRGSGSDIQRCQQQAAAQTFPVIVEHGFSIHIPFPGRTLQAVTIRETGTHFQVHHPAAALPYITIHALTKKSFRYFTMEIIEFLYLLDCETRSGTDPMLCDVTTAFKEAIPAIHESLKHNRSNIPGGVRGLATAIEVYEVC